MTVVSLVLIAIIILFFLSLAANSIFNSKICSICVSISLTWIGLLSLYWLGYVLNTLIIGILMGQSITGVYYLAEKKTNETLHLFRLPFLLTLTLAAYLLISKNIEMTKEVGIIVLLWLAFSILYLFRNYTPATNLVKKIINCCKNW
jgi:hypothetical protein